MAFRGSSRARALSRPALAPCWHSGENLGQVGSGGPAVGRGGGGIDRGAGGKGRNTAHTHKLKLCHPRTSWDYATPLTPPTHTHQHAPSPPSPHGGTIRAARLGRLVICAGGVPGQTELGREEGGRCATMTAGSDEKTWRSPGGVYPPPTRYIVCSRSW